METNIVSGARGNLGLQDIVLLLINSYITVYHKDVPLLLPAWRIRVKASKLVFINKIMVRSLRFLCLSLFLLSFWTC